MSLDLMVGPVVSQTILVGSMGKPLDKLINAVMYGIPNMNEIQSGSQSSRCLVQQRVAALRAALGLPVQQPRTVQIAAWTWWTGLAESMNFR